MFDNSFIDDSPPAPRQRRSKERLNYILETAAHLFEERGVAHVSTNDIAATAGISIGSIYRYFPDKNAILAALIELYIQRVEALFTMTANNPQTLQRNWREVIYLLLLEWSTCLDESNANTYSRFYRSNPLFGNTVQTQRKEFWNKFTAIIRAKCRSLPGEPQLHSIAGACVVSMVAALDAAQDMKRHNDTAKRDMFLNECATMVGNYLELSLAPPKK
jgi:AcrR family transcriptional regulator